MDFFTMWMLSLEEAIENVIEYGIDRQAIENLFDVLGYNGVYDNSYMSMSAQKMIFLLGDSNENYSPEEIQYMSCSNIVKQIFTIEDLNAKDEYYRITFFYFEIDDDDIEKDTTACAVIKLINKAFKGLNCFLIKNRESLCFGANYTGNEYSYNGAIISNWFEKPVNTYDFAEFAFENIFTDELLESHMGFQEAVIRNSHLIPDEFHGDWDTIRYTNEDYVSIFVEIGDLYKLDCSKVIQEYKKWTNEAQERKICSMYNTIACELSFIDSNQITSYEMLEMARKSEVEKMGCGLPLKNLSCIEESNGEDEVDEKIRRLDDEVFEDVEKILDYI